MDRLRKLVLLKTLFKPLNTQKVVLCCLLVDPSPLKSLETHKIKKPILYLPSSLAPQSACQQMASCACSNIFSVLLSLFVS